MGENQRYVGILLDTLEKKQGVLRDILLLTQDQEQVCKQDDYNEERMSELMNKKEVQIAKLNELDDGFDRVYSRVRLEVRDHKEEYKEEILKMQEYIRTCTDLGNAIMVLEDRNRSRIEQFFMGKKSEYKMSRAKTAVASNYLKTMNNTKVMSAYFVDKKKQTTISMACKIF